MPEENKKPIQTTEEQLTQEQYLELKKQFPKELLDYALAEQTTQGIASICLEFGIREEEKIKNISYLLTLVLLDKISLAEVREILEDRFEVEPNEAEKMIEVIRETLIADKEAILKYLEKKPTVTTQAKRAPTAVPPKPPVEREEKEEIPKKNGIPSKIKSTAKKDIYREPIDEE